MLLFINYVKKRDGEIYMPNYTQAEQNGFAMAF